VRLPDNIERELRSIEADYNARPGQRAGAARLRSLRWAVEDALRRLGYQEKDREVSNEHDAH